MILRTNNMRRLRGFTLVEMLIVGALIALFSTIAIFGIQSQYQANQRKAVIGEARQVATALDFAYNDLGFFPKIGLLPNSQQTLRLESNGLFGDPNFIYGIMDSFGIGTTAFIDDIQDEDLPFAWRGPYFSTSQSRTRISQGRGGSRDMIITSVNNAAVDWPVDVFNNPYMLYSLSIDPEADPNDATLFFPVQNADGTPNLTNPGAEGNFANAVVSYGPNQVPGGGSLFLAIPPFDKTAPNDNSPWGARLYYGDPDNTINPLTLETRNLLAGAAGEVEANVWSRLFAYRALGAGGAEAVLADGDTEETELNDDVDGITGSIAVGITDPGSDDIVFTF